MRPIVAPASCRTSAFAVVCGAIGVGGCGNQRSRAQPDRSPVSSRLFPASRSSNEAEREHKSENRSGRRRENAQLGKLKGAAARRADLHLISLLPR
ncbi:hypothetical protein K458DRAFT_122964 [Lentithecium fluviatile CBS 122367]|uniref:Lipoprotein n=1 Tax=Lentithecium fluviatile CBS 122367 TaxID=1168545 RepID=A0A6G1JFL7_9PLEO|nr:hypothetical protein K458DRAFT_122964 [Lentithecium fluviatile CBS 122367]